MSRIRVWLKFWNPLDNSDSSGILFDSGKSDRSFFVVTISIAYDNVSRSGKSAAALQGVTLREWVLKAIEEKLRKAR